MCFGDVVFSLSLMVTFGLAAVLVFCDSSARNRSPIELLKLELSTKAESCSSSPN